MRWLLAIAICGCATPPAAGGAARPEAPRPEAPRPEAPRAAPSEAAIALPGGANALWWDAASSTLYLTDSNASALLAWSDAGGLRTETALPADPAGVSLGGFVRRGDGTTVIASFGFGTKGGLFAVAGTEVTALTGLDPVRRRVGLAQDAAGTIYSAYFVGGRGKPPAGGVAVVTIAGAAATETEIASGFHKAVGVVATPAAVFVSDQTDRAIFRIAVPGYAVTRLATAPAVDLLAMLPGGDLLTGGGPTISRITQTGEVTALPGKFEQVRGLAYDPAKQRLFVVDHSVTVGVPDKLRILHLAH
ncbi:MAG TPA: hypothetical protein VHT91_39815 [Kofleriaceae bacterium]|jgi:hypothetical protein|nr:hypothetical protein [Kofleriaceae bacterium]